MNKEFWQIISVIVLGIILLPGCVGPQVKRNTYKLNALQESFNDHERKAKNSTDIILNYIDQDQRIRSFHSAVIASLESNFKQIEKRLSALEDLHKTKLKKAQEKPK